MAGFDDTTPAVGGAEAAAALVDAHDASQISDAPDAPDTPDMQAATATMRSLVDALDHVLSCSREVIELAVATFAAGGHLLLEDVPGVGKTTLAHALASAVGGEHRRIQFTPDMLPSDLTGVNVFSQATGRFEFHPGPLFANIVIADEVNRANPKAQSAMLEAMGERRISVDGDTYELPDPYMVIATQNPIELEGTYPLPEAQLDRFMTCTDFGYPEAEREAAMLTAPDSFHPLSGLARVCDVERMAAVRAAVERVTLDARMARYVVAITSATRNYEGVRYGASPRASLHMAAMARAHALVQGRAYVIADDVRAIAVPTLSHRLVLDGGGYGMPVRARARRLVDSLVRSIAVPRADDAGTVGLFSRHRRAHGR